MKSLIRVVELWDILVKLEDISTNGSNNRQKENASAKYIAAIEKEMKSKIFYLVDIFYHINLLNLYLQGRNANLLNCSEKIKSFINKLDLWAALLQRHDFTFFRSLSSTNPCEEVIFACTSLFSCLREDMIRRFHDIMELKHPKWINNFQNFDPVADTNLDSKIAA